MQESRTILVKKSSTRGASRAIIVDGVEWGTLHRHNRGVYGYFYTADDSASRRVYKMGERPSEWKIWSDKSANRVHHDTRPIEERLISEITAMIKDGALRSPGVVSAEQEARAASREANRKAVDDAEQNAMNAKAEEVLAGGVQNIGDLKARIIAAMKWAQGR